MEKIQIHDQTPAAATTIFGDKPPQTLTDYQTLVNNLPDKTKEEAMRLKQSAIQAVLSNPNSPLATLAKEIGKYIKEKFGKANDRQEEEQQILMLAHYYLALEHVEKIQIKIRFLPKR